MITIIEGCGSNIASLQFALKRLGANATLTADPEKIKNADRVILPGVGTARSAMQQLQTRNLINVIKNLEQPVLGICLGMQLLFEFSEEDSIETLGIIPGKVKRFIESNNRIVPHMGWNRVKPSRANTLLTNEIYQYFVHSYYAPINEYTLATCLYDEPFSALVQKDNFYGAQFHPEKSGAAGLNLLKNFVSL